MTPEGGRWRGWTALAVDYRHASDFRMFPRYWLHLLKIPSIPKITKHVTNPVGQSQEKHPRVTHNVRLKERDFH